MSYSKTVPPNPVFANLAKRIYFSGERLVHTEASEKAAIRLQFEFNQWRKAFSQPNQLGAIASSIICRRSKEMLTFEKRESAYAELASKVDSLSLAPDEKMAKEMLEQRDQSASAVSVQQQQAALLTDLGFKADKPPLAEPGQEAPRASEETPENPYSKVKVAPSEEKQ